MKKSIKIAIATVLILLAGTAGVLYYFLNVKEYDVADEKVEEITKTEYKVALPDLDNLAEGADESKGDGTENSNGGSEDAAADSSETAMGSNGNAKEAAGSDTGSGNEAGTSSASNKDGKKDPESKNNSSKVTEGKKKDDSAAKEDKADENAEEEEKQPEITAEMIKGAYRPSFEELQAQANAKIDALVNAAFSEYSAKKESGESISFTYFYRKYTSAGKELEASTDTTFNYIYDSLVSDLETRGFSASEASEFKTQYESAKAARENALIDKAKSAL